MFYQKSHLRDLFSFGEWHGVGHLITMRNRERYRWIIWVESISPLYLINYYSFARWTRQSPIMWQLPWQCSRVMILSGKTDMLQIVAVISQIISTKRHSKMMLVFPKPTERRRSLLMLNQRCAKQLHRQSRFRLHMTIALGSTAPQSFYLVGPKD